MQFYRGGTKRDVPICPTALCWVLLRHLIKRDSFHQLDIFKRALLVFNTVHLKQPLQHAVVDAVCTAKSGAPLRGAISEDCDYLRVVRPQRNRGTNIFGGRAP